MIRGWIDLPQRKWWEALSHVVQLRRANSANGDVRTYRNLPERWSQGSTRVIRLTLKSETMVDDAVEAFLPEALDLVSRPRLNGPQRQ